MKSRLSSYRKWDIGYGDYGIWIFPFLSFSFLFNSSFICNYHVSGVIILRLSFAPVFVFCVICSAYCFFLKICVFWYLRNYGIIMTVAFKCFWSPLLNTNTLLVWRILCSVCQWFIFRSDVTMCQTTKEIIDIGWCYHCCYKFHCSYYCSCYSYRQYNFNSSFI